MKRDWRKDFKTYEVENVSVDDQSYSINGLEKSININPFTAPACSVSGMNDARTHLQTVYFPVL